MEINRSVNVIGQMNIDILYLDINRFPKYGEEVFADNFKIALGGGPMVIPIMLSQLGIPTQLGTYLSDDYQSRIASDLLNEKKYRNVALLPTEKKHPVVVTSVITEKEERTFICYNEGANELDLDVDVVYNFYADSSICFCPQDLKIAEQLKKEGKILVFDVGWTDDLSLEKVSEHLKIVDYFTPNEKEAEKITGTSDVKKSLDILAEYLDYPMIKLANEGCAIKLEGEYYLIPALEGVNTIDPTGAGDNFLTGLIYGIYNEYEFVDSIKIGNILGGLSTEVLGCYRDDISEELIMDKLNTFPRVKKL